jgi:hypothetical protein
LLEEDDEIYFETRAEINKKKNAAIVFQVSNFKNGVGSKIVSAVRGSRKHTRMDV